jgi:hypothetical protein
MKSVRIRSRILALAGLLLCVACAQTNLSAHEAKAPVLAHVGEGNETMSQNAGVRRK